MNLSRSVKIILAAMACIVAASTVVLVYFDNVRLRRRVADTRRHYEQSATLQTENAALRNLTQTNVRSEEEAATAVRAQTSQARAEIAALEKSAEQRYAERMAQAAREGNTLATNRNPRHGMTRVENFQDRGQATPAAAFETMIWAALKGNEDVLGRVCTMTRTTHTQAEALLARLPLDASGKWTADKLAALWVGGLVNELSALEITSAEIQDSEKAVLTFRIPSQKVEENVNLKLTPAGWKIMLPGNAMEKLERKLSVATPGTP